ncbi:CBS domain-containing protein [Deinococcus budaensis]|uniref:CBS domain-containing protein n=1 Tax=Deinococcus budaensis TaxID=1665626 RepID=A0A7W8GIQ9_9DEIO|nr:CBS domain-containing protein [Deinococcus budaensis]MBB5236069.1 CBS domain-containing protein [Deinococcus budaensis]
MSSSPVCVTPGHSVPDAARLLRVRGIRRLPVLEGQHLVGIVTDRDLREALPGQAGTLSLWEATAASPGVCVGDVMRRSVVTTTPDADARGAACTLLQRRIGGMPVVDRSGGVVGMLTVTDLLRDYASARPPEVPSPTDPAHSGPEAPL